MSVYQRLEAMCDGAWDLDRLLNAYLNEDCNDYERHSKEDFELVKAADPRYMDHGDVLALSFGGSNTKLILASTKGGHLVISHMRALRAPEKVTHLYDYLDELLFGDQVVKDYLLAPGAVLSVVLPVMIGEDGIPQHPEKMPTIDGLLARKPEDFVPEMNFTNNMKRYFASRGVREPKLCFQADPIAAHIGGFSQIELAPDEKSFLLVCGTGMATADDHVSRVISRTQIMDFDEELFPKEETEGYIYEATCGGLHFWELLRRAIILRSKEEGSALAGKGAEDLLQNSDDSVFVSQLWKAGFKGAEDAKVTAARERLGPEAFAELQKIADILMDRLALTLADSVLATAVKMNRQYGFSKYHVILEGSVALDSDTKAVMDKKIDEQLKNTELFAKYGAIPPVLDLEQRPRKEVFYAEEIPEKVRHKTEISLLGTAVLGVTHDILR